MLTRPMISKRTLPNGLVVAVRNMPTADSAAIVFQADPGGGATVLADFVR